ncbi:MAG: DUF362 domain-containing protein [Desulfarculaceae bacterium]|jgi:uncharacterized protein (DUF362 family)/Pyruvate/2-oxoacid:ferredoxin oxidoreductase delta subunit
MNTVALLSCPDYDPIKVAETVKRAVDLVGGIKAFVRPGQRVLLKPNLLAARPPEKRVTTDPAVVMAVGRLVQKAGGEVIIGDSPALDPFRRVARLTGMREVAEALGADLSELSESTRIKPSSESIFKDLHLASQALEADVVINLPKLKTHCQMLLTLGVKNLFGTVVAQRKAEWHSMAGISRSTFASLLLDICRAVKPALTILDGVWGMEGHGPSNGSPRHFGLLAASADPLALDLAICRLLEVPWDRFPLYGVAVQRGFFNGDPRSLMIKGEDERLFQAKGLILPELDSLDFLPRALSPLARRYLASRPVRLQDRCTNCQACVDICPVQCISQKPQGLTFDYDRCIRCYCCQEVCPQDAIGFKKGLILRALNWMGR